MSTYIYDIETDGLDPTLIWCIVAYDIDTKDVRVFRHDDGTLMDFNDLLVAGNTLVGHNVINYDNPAIEKLLGLRFDAVQIADTLVLSRLANPSREGGHSLGNWGQLLGFPKGDFKNFGTFDEAMIDYCIQDVKVNARVYRALAEELKGFSHESIALEHDVQKIISKQMHHGWFVDTERMERLLMELTGRLKELESSVHYKFPPIQHRRALHAQKTKAGSVSKMALDDEGKRVRLGAKEYEDICRDGSIVRVTQEPFNLGSRKQIGERLMSVGWKPKEFTESGQPKVSEEILETVDIPEAKDIIDYLIVQKRIAQVRSWVEATDVDQRVRGYVNSCGAVTGRMTHSKPNVAQVPANRKPYGEECRKCWTVPQGYTLVGCDAAGLELRMLAHYMNDEDYTYEVINGDVHSKNQRAAGLPTRDDAKTFIYAFLYGAGDAKIGSIIGGSAKAGSSIKSRFLDSVPALDALRRNIERLAARGYLRGLDGRRVWVRSEHAALNTLLQSAGAIVMKKALVVLDELVRSYGLDAHPVGNIHDEFQFEVRSDQAEFFGSLAEGAIVKAGELLQLNCPLAAEAKYGESWSDTH